MAYGRVDPHKLRMPTAFEAYPQIELQMWGRVPSGQQLRVVVFDVHLLQRGALRSEFVTLYSRLEGSGEQLLPNAVRDLGGLVGDGTNGVLLCFETSVEDETPLGGPESARRWAFTEGTNVRACKPSKTLLTIAVGLRNTSNRIAYGPQIHLPELPGRRKRLLALAVIDPHDLIIYSNAWRSGESASRNPQGVPIMLDSKAASVAVAAQVGGQGLGTGRQQTSGRALPDYEVTGKYEAFLNAGDRLNQNAPCMMVQLCTAGGAVAGWLAPPPEQVTGHAHLRIPVPAVPAPLVPGEYGSLLGHFEAGGYELLWAGTTGSRDPLPELVDGRLESKRHGTGRLERQGQVLVLRLHQGASEVRLFLHQADRTPRRSNNTIEILMNEQRRLSLIVDHGFRANEVHPIPLYFYRRLGADMDPDGRLSVLISAYLHTRAVGNVGQRQITPASNAARSVISNYLEKLVTSDEFGPGVLTYFDFAAKNKRLEHGGETRTIWDWLREVVADHTDGLLTTGLDEEQLLSRVERGFVAVGVIGRDRFVYQVEFFPLGAEAKLLVKAGGYYFEAKVTQKVKNRDGTLREPPVRSEWYKTHVPLRGLFGTLGGAVGAGAKWGAGSMVTEMEFHSFRDLKRADFEKVTIVTFNTTGPAAGALALSTAAAEANHVNLYLSDSDGRQSILSGSSADAMILPSLKTPPQRYQNPFELDAQWVSGHGGLGWMWRKDSSKAAPQGARPPQASDDPESTRGNAQTNVQVYFRHNSASLEGVNLTAFEEVLAREHALFVTAEGTACGVGHTSPEGGTLHNSELSFARANALVDHLALAFPSRLNLRTMALGYGEQAANNAGLSGIEDIKRSDRKALEDYIYKAEHIFPQYRTAMLWVHGIQVVELTIGKAVL